MQKGSLNIRLNNELFSWTELDYMDIIHLYEKELSKEPV